jgi:chloramphenicol-sensitive protein RarD
VLCYLLWGAAPLLFLALGRLGADAFEIVAQRAVWAAPCAFVLVIVAGQGGEVLRLLLSPRRLGLLTISSVAIASGWTMYVWAVDHGHKLDASLGYYINQLMNMAAGALFFRERISRSGLVAIGLAAIGVVLQGMATGHLPLIALFLATTFWIYGLIRKQIDAEAQSGLFVECLILMGSGVAYAVWPWHAGGGVFGHTPSATLLMMLAGPVTVAPLALFSWTARRLPLSLIGFLQFISPTMGFAFGAWLQEPLTALRLVSFGFIWTGVAVFAAGSWLAARQRRPISSDSDPV